MKPEQLPFFVYGTLKRGEVREKRWPHPPQRVIPATAAGRLYDLGPYPALVEGDDTILGELWFIAPADFETTLRVLDEIECYGHEDVDLYARKIIDCRSLDGERHRAHAYFFATPSQLAGRPAVVADAFGTCHWTGAHD